MVNYAHPIEATLDLLTILFLITLLLLSLLSLCFIFHLSFKSRTFCHLQSFNSLWTVRLLLLVFVVLWSFNELLRLPSFRRFYLYGPHPFLSAFFHHDKGHEEEDQICKFHVVFSLGFFQPAFLGTLLFLVDVSIKKNTPNVSWAVVFVLTTCFPLVIVQTFFLFTPLEKMMSFVSIPGAFRVSSIVKEHGEFTVAHCKYPLLSTLIFGVFAATYFMWFLFSLWKVLSCVINRGLRTRITMLAVTVLVPLPVQVILLGVSVMWDPDQLAFSAISFVVFLSTFMSFAMGQGILVIKPITDSLAAGGVDCRWSPQVEEVDDRSRRKNYETKERKRRSVINLIL